MATRSRAGWGVRSGVLAFLERERMAVLVPAGFCALVLLVLPQLLVADSWLALVAGRSIAQHGLPTTETLTVYPHGHDWIDQQWLSQLALYELHELGGMRLLLLVSAGLIVGAFSLAVVAARRAGASPLAVAIVAFVALASYGEVALSMRPQIFGLVLFVVALWLLVEDARRPSRRVFWVLPLLVLWANLHGSVLLGAGLVVLRGACAVVVAWRGGGEDARRGLLLAGGAIVAIFATPYALDMPHYYASTAFNPQFTSIIGEWQRTTPDPLTAPFYFLGFLAAGLVAKHPRSVTTYEKLALLATGVMGLMALRNMAWFALAAIVILPLALHRSLPADEGDTPRRATLPIAYGPLVCVALVLVVTVLRPSTWFEPQGYPAGAADTTARIVAADPNARVFSDILYADWLMWKHPSLEGRVAFDSRVEMLARRQLTAVSRFVTQQADGWRRAADGYRAVVLDRTAELDGSSARYRQLLKEPGARLAYLDTDAAVVLRAR